MEIENPNTNRDKEMLKNKGMEYRSAWFKVHFYLKQLEFEKKKYENEESVSWKVLLGPDFRFPLILSLILIALQQLSGIDAVIFYAAKMFQGKDKRISAELGRYLAILWALIKFSTASVASGIVDKTGRRPLFLFGSAAISFTLIILAYLSFLEYYYWKAVFLYIFIIAYSLSFGPIVWIFVPETLPDKGVTLVLFNHWIFSFLIVQSYPYLLKVN